jgi:aspartyl-tRNA(Asn)/glutamyl-tRNA(Gln) amidotransferase subunit A
MVLGDHTDRREVLKGMSAATLMGTGVLRSGAGHSTPIDARGASATFDAGRGLTWLPAWRLREMIVKREVSSAEVVEHFLERIEALDPQLHAFRKVDAKSAREQAARADKSLRSGAAPGLLHGVPIAMKELFFVKGFPVPGSYFNYLGSGKDGALPIAERDDIEVERLRAGGAIIVGITVAAGGLAPGMPDAAQLPRNPWNISHTSGSSSAGNGAAVAGGLLPMAIGDDGGGSVRVPAAFCGLLGLHPTRGRIPHVDYKAVAPRPTVTVGPMTRSVRDAAIALQILSGPDGRDFVCMQEEPPDFVAAVDYGIQGKRFAWTDNFGFASMPASPQSPRVTSTAYAATRVLQQAGGSVTRTSMTWEDPLVSWLGAQQLVAGTNVPGLFEQPLSEAEMVAALGSRQRNWQRFREAFGEYDFIVSPTIHFTAPAIADWVELWKQQGGRPKHHLILDVLGPTMMCNVLGLPAISVPAGFVDRLPVAIQIIGKPASEAQLLQAAQAFLAARS